jgi:hypothetical protein
MDAQNAGSAAAKIGKISACIDFTTTRSCLGLPEGDDQVIEYPPPQT